MEMGSEEERRKILESKKKLRIREREIWIEKDLTWKERKNG